MPCPAGGRPGRWSEVSGSPADGRAPDSSLSPPPRESLQPGVPVPGQDPAGVRFPSPQSPGGPHQKRAAFTRLGTVVARYHRLVVAVWVVVVVGSALLVPRFQSSVTGPPLDVGASDSYQAQEILRTRFDQPFAEQDLIVFESENLVATDLPFQAVIGTALDRVQEIPGVVNVIGPFDPRAEGLVAEEGLVATAVVGLSGSNADRQALAPRLTQAAASAATDEVRIYVTGRSPLIAELVEQQEADLLRAERLGVPIALLILLISSGAVVAAGLPLVLAMSGVIVTIGTLGAASAFTEFNLFVPNIASMIGLGVGIDYALFIVNRFREELARGTDPRLAVTTTTATAGRTVFFSGLTVLLSLAGLLLVDARIFPG